VGQLLDFIDYRPEVVQPMPQQQRSSMVVRGRAVVASGSSEKTSTASNRCKSRKVLLHTATVCVGEP
jgi:hypothetical protein